MKVFLLNPPSLPKKTTDRRVRCTANVPPGWSHPPLTLGYLAAILKKINIEPVLIDAVLEEYDLNKILELINKNSPDLIISLIGLFTFPYDLKVLKAIKIKTKIPMIVTGEAAAALPEKILKENPEIDYGIISEPEASIKEIIEMLTGKRKEKNVNGLIYRSGKKIKINKCRLIEDLDTIPFPDRSLIKNEEYHCMPFFTSPYTDLLTSRGCPNQCKFCTSKKYWGGRFRLRSADNIIEEIKECIKKYGLKNFFILDDIFIMDKERLEKLNREFRKLKIRWAIETRVDLVNKEMLKEMKNAGCIYIHYGVESGSQKILDYYRKGITIKQIKNAIKWTKEAGILACGTIIIGNPIETKEDIERSIKLAKEVKMDFVHFSPLIPFPSCEFFQEYKDQGLLKHENFLLYTKPNIIFKPKNVSEEYIRKAIERAYKATLFRPRFIIYHLKRIFLEGDLSALKQMLNGALWAVKTFFSR